MKVQSMRLSDVEIVQLPNLSQRTVTVVDHWYIDLIDGFDCTSTNRCTRRSVSSEEDFAAYVPPALFNRRCLLWEQAAQHCKAAGPVFDFPPTLTV